MGVTRDTSADAFAAMLDEQAARARGAHDPAVTLSGTQAHAVRTALGDAYALLERLERQTKVFRVREDIRVLRAAIGTAHAYLPAPRR